jgi:hypothetical protein
VISSAWATFLIFAIVAAVTTAWVLWTSRDLPFDHARWHAPLEKQRSQWRLRMASWIVKKSYLLGKTRGEVLSELGSPAEAIWLQFSDWELTFDLYATTFYFDSLALAVNFDGEGRVKECGIVAG